jgi:hypothetical protein
MTIIVVYICQRFKLSPPKLIIPIIAGRYICYVVFHAVALLYYWQRTHNVKLLMFFYKSICQAYAYIISRSC